MSREYEGRPITDQTLTVNGLGVGLQSPLKVDRLDVHIGDRLILIADIEVTEMRYPRNKDDHDAVNEGIVAGTLDAAVLKPRGNDGKLVKAMLVDRRHRIQTALAAMEGQGNLDDDENGLGATREKLGANQ